MKSLRIIQVLAKIARVICIIGFIFSIIATISTISAIIVLPLCKDTIIYQGKTLEQLLLQYGITMPMAYSAIVMGIVSSAGSIFLSRYNWIYYRDEIALGTPFSMPFVKKTRRTALVNIFVSLGIAIIGGIVTAIVLFANGYEVKIDYSSISSVWYGIFLLIISLFMEYGAPKEEIKEEPTKTE